MDPQIITKGGVEKWVDRILFFVVTLPLLLFFSTMPFCPGATEGTACSFPVLGSIFDAVTGIFLLVAFTSIIWGPILLVLAVLGLVAKIRRFARGYRPATAFEVVKEIVFLIPFVAIIFLIVSILNFMTVAANPPNIFK